MPIPLSSIAPVMRPAPEKLDVNTFVASPHKAPRQWQSAAPPDTYASRYAPVGPSEDLDRVLALPRRPQLDPSSVRGQALADMMTARYGRGERACVCATFDTQIRAGKRQCIRKLNPVQAWALYEVGIAGGLIASIPVGTGKSLLDILVLLAFQEFDPAIRSGLLLVPPNLVEQLMHEYQLVREHFRVPEIWYHNGSSVKELAPGMPVLHVRPYSLLSRPENSNWVRLLNPQVVISDECDKLKEVKGAGTSRIMRQFYEQGSTKFAGWTGSLTDHSISEYYHLAAIALQYKSPLPLDLAVVEEWGRAIDAPKASPPRPDTGGLIDETPSSDGRAPPGELLAFCDEGEDVLEGFRRRLAETMGVVISTGSSVDVDLTVREREAPALPASVLDELNRLRAGWIRPDGEELIDAMSVAKCAQELACGMFYRWKFPRAEPEPLIKEWLAARKDYNKELRAKLLDRKEYLDSPMLCEHAAQRFHGDRPKHDDKPEWQSYAWPRWRDIKPQVKPAPDVVWIDDFLARDAAEWARENTGIVWYGIVEFGRKVAELSGMPLHGGGPDAGARLIGGRRGNRVYTGEDGSRSVICSMKSHGRGRDGLQRLFQEQLVCNPPASATAWEQLLGRLHRQGQSGGEVTAWFYRHTEEIRATVDQALRRAAYVQATLGATQKLQIGFLDR